MSRSPNRTIVGHDPSLIRRLTLITATLFTFIAAQVLGAELLYLMCATFISVLIIAWLLARVSLQSVKVDRFIPLEAREGETIEMRFRLTQRGKFLRVFLSLRDTLPEWLVPVGDQESHIIPLLLPHKPVDLSQRLLATKRGHYRVGPAVLMGSDPLGLFATSVVYTARSEITVVPAALSVKTLGALPAGGTGMNPYQTVMAKVGGSDFHGVREYQPHDELRRIHWKSTAHHGRFNVIEFEDTPATEMTVLLEVDSRVQRGEGTLSTLEVGIKIAATLVEFAIRHGVPVRLVADDDRLRPARFGWDADHEHRLMQALARLEATPTAGLLKLAIEERIVDTGRGSFVIISPCADRDLIELCKLICSHGALATCFILDAGAFASYAPGEHNVRSGKRREKDVKARSAPVELVPQTVKQLMQAGVAVKVIRPDTDLRSAIEQP